MKLAARPKIVTIAEVVPRYDEIVLTDSAYRRGYGEEDVAEML